MIKFYTKAIVIIALLLSCSLTVSAQDPILDLSFDGVALDNSPNGTTVCGPVRFGTDRFGEVGRSAIFHPNHYDNLILEPGTVNIQREGPLSFSLWLNTELDGTTKYVFTTSDSSRNHAGVTLVIDIFGRPAIQLGDGFGGGRQNRNTYTGSEPIPSNQWTNVTFTIDQGAGPNIYIDGIPQTVSAPDGGNTSNLIRHNVAPFKIGQKWEFFYVGGLDDLKLYDRILTLQEIVDIANNVSSNITPSSSLVSVYPTVTQALTTLDVEHRIDKAQLSVINSKGQPCAFEMVGDKTLDVSPLPAGQYFIVYHKAEERFVSQFTKL